MARFYGRSYRGRKYYFQVVGIEGNVIYLQNMETFSSSKVNSNFVNCKDGYIKLEDIIERQYHRDGMAIYNRGGGDFSEGNTYWTNITSEERYSKEHPITTFGIKWIGYAMSFALVIGFVFPPIGILSLYIIGLLFPIYMIIKTIDWLFK